MPFVPVANTVMAEMRCTLDGQQVENTLYFRVVGGAVNLTNMGTLAVQLSDWWGDNIVPLVADDLGLREIYLTDLTTATGPTLSYTTNLPVFGALTEEPLPNSVSLCVSFRTIGRGRSSRGRNYMMGVTDNNVVNNTFAEAFVTAAAAAYDQLTLFDDAIDWNWGVVSRYTEGAPRVAGLFQQITGVVVIDRTVDSQRRRLPGRGS